MQESDLIHGIDVSVCQEDIDWSWVAQQNIKFAIMRSGVGNDEACDIKCAKNIQGCKDNGILPAIYHFAYPLPSAPGHINRDPISQSQWHFDNTPDQSLPVVLDLEWDAPENWAKWGQSATQIQQWTLQYLDNYTKLSGKVPAIYSYPYYLRALKPIDPAFANYPLHIASYTFATEYGEIVEPAQIAPFPTWTIWQTAGGTLMKLSNGIPVDTDVVKDLTFFGC